MKYEHFIIKHLLFKLCCIRPFNFRDYHVELNNTKACHSFCLYQFAGKDIALLMSLLVDSFLSLNGSSAEAFKW